MNIKDYFSFTQGEKRGVIFLLAIIFLLIIAIPITTFFDKNEAVDFSAFEAAITQFEKEQDALSNKKWVKQTEFFPFNPNTISNEEWLKLGFKEWQVKAINNYKAKGGHWRTKSDVKKIYGLKEEHYQELLPFILLPEELISSSKISPEQQSFSKKDIPPLIIDINTADTTTFKKLKGIGTVYANRIVKYRKLLGGFISIEQLKEVYGLNEEIYHSIQPQVIIKDQSISKIDINTANANILKKHPYIDWKIANAIEKYRKANDDYENIEELKKIHLINEETFLKIAPYLSID